MSYEQFVFINLEKTILHITDEWGAPIVVKPNQVVAGTWYARFAKPSGVLTMVHADRVPAEDIVFHAKARNPRVKGSWEETANRVDPILVHLPERSTPVIEVTEVIEDFVNEVPDNIDDLLSISVEEEVIEEPLFEGSVEQEDREVEEEAGEELECEVDETPKSKNSPTKRKKRKTKTHKKPA
jgi:hypothetical protein